MAAPFPLKLRLINVSQHLQEIKACSPASRCRSGRLGYQAGNINIAAVRGADVSGGLHQQNYNGGDYRGRLWDLLGNTSGPALRAPPLPVHQQGCRLRGFLSQSRHRVTSSTTRISVLGNAGFAQTNAKIPPASGGAVFSPGALFLLGSGEEAGVWRLGGDEVSASGLLPCKAPRERAWGPGWSCGRGGSGSGGQTGG